MTQNYYQKGSEWRKWDLHIHTPHTKLNNNYGGDNNVWDKFCNEVEKSDVSVFGITDYFSVENYFLFIEEFNTRYPNSIKKFFPNVEFRIDSKNSQNEHIQIHVLFSNEIKKEKLDNFFTRLTLVSTDNIHLTNKYCTANDLNEVGYDKAMITLTNLKEQLESDFTKDEYIIIGVANGYGSLRPGPNDGRGSEYAKEIDKICHAFFGNKENTDFFLNKIEGRLAYNLPPKPVLKASDCHSFEDINNKLGKYFTWVKADPTFEGLKQIIYEPEERVRIQENNPEFEFDKPTFSKITIENPINVFKNEKVKFNKTELPLNKNLVTIIGGRGTGKSLLVNYLAHSLNKSILAYENKQNKQVEFNDSIDFEIEWLKNNISSPDKTTFNAEEKGNLDFIFIEQGKLKNISDYRTLSNEIKKLLKIDNLQFDDKLDKKITQLLEEIKKLKEWFNYENEYGEKINDKQFNKTKRQEAEKLLETIKTEENKQKLERYTSNIKKISDYENILSELKELREDLEEYQTSKNKIINNINSKIQNEVKNINIPIINFEKQKESIKSIEEKYTELLDKIKNENNEIKEQFEKQGYKGDLNTLLSNAKKYQKDIQEADLKLTEIESQEKILNDKIQQRNNLCEELKKEYERQAKEIEYSWNNLFNHFSEEHRKIIENLLKNRNISINGVTYFDIKEFDKKLEDYLDRRTYKKLSEDLNITDLASYWDFIKNSLKDFIEGNKADATKRPLDDLFLSLKERKNYLYVIPEIKYMNKTLDQLSVGQRGTLYLLLQLATNAFSSPLVFDQPEDDLDNKFITEELVNILKELKIYRQIIITTHNANLVVTADAEQVIIANNIDECLSYVSGSLENPEIIKNVCEILEGGKEAFLKRERKYNL